mgnify:CR=1 FL=1
MKRCILQTKFYLFSVILSLVSCSQDELAEQGTPLPDGMYPMTFTVVQVAPESTPQTRVIESGDGMSSQWTNGERIKITVSGPGNNMEAEMLRINGVFVPDKRLYWQNTNNATVNAWYSNIEGKGTMPSDYTVSLADQSSGLAYVLKTDPIPANYKTGDIVLNFYHQLAKIRVKLDNGSYQGDLSNATVKVKGCTSCTVKDGDVSGGSEEAYIPMHKNGEYYEANLVPNTLQASEAFEISAGDKTTKASLKEDISLEKGKVHTITITVNAEGPEEITSGETIDKPGDYIMKDNITESVTLIGDGITLTLDGISSTANNTIHITSGNPTLVVKGTSNSFSCSDTPILLDPGANVTIKGATDEPTDSKLTIRTSSTDGVAGIGSASQSSCGNISIANVTLDVHGGTGTYGGAAIGTNGSFGSSCGDITIENSIVYAKGGTGASAIGLSTGSDSRSCGEINIIHSKIFATTTYDDFYDSYAACIGHGAYAERTPVSVGKITITTTETKEDFFGTDRFKALDANGNEVTTGFYKVGKCTNSKYQSLQTWQGVIFNGESLADGNSNGYK